MLTLFPVETAATAMEPRKFTAVCSTTLPMAVIEYWSPMGTPMPQRIFIRPQSGFRSSADILKIGKRRNI